MTQVASEVDSIVASQIYVLVLLPVERHKFVADFRSVLSIIMYAELTNHRFAAHGFGHLFLEEFDLIRCFLTTGLSFHFTFFNSESRHAFVLLLPAEIIQTFAIQEHKFEQLLVVVWIHFETEMIQISAEEVVTVCNKLLRHLRRLMRGELLLHHLLLPLLIHSRHCFGVIILASIRMHSCSAGDRVN